MRDNIQGGALTETSLLILLSLFEANHGYGIGKHIKELTNGRVTLGMGTLYGALNNMLQKKWIKEHSTIDRKVLYIITDDGISQVQNEKKRIKQLLGEISRCLDKI